jgi:hypothetical protein
MFPKTAIPGINGPDVTIMSDLDNGLKEADNELGQAYCTHLKANIQNFGLAATKSVGICQNK